MRDPRRAERTAGLDRHDGRLDRGRNRRPVRLGGRLRLERGDPLLQRGDGALLDRDIAAHPELVVQRAGEDCRGGGHDDRRREDVSVHYLSMLPSDDCAFATVSIAASTSLPTSLILATSPLSMPVRTSMQPAVA